MTLTPEELAVENEVESITLMRVDHPKWRVEVFRLSDEAPDRLHVDVQTHDVFQADDMPAFTDACCEALARVKSLGGLRD